MTLALYKGHLSLRAVQRAFYKKGVVAQKKPKERASVFIMIAGDHDKNRDRNGGLLVRSGVALISPRTIDKLYLNGKK